MQDPETEARVAQVVAATLNIPVMSLSAEAQLGALPGWESVAHLNLVLGLEQEFDCSLEPQDVSESATIGDIARRVIEKEA